MPVAAIFRKLFPKTDRTRAQSQDVSLGESVEVVEPVLMSIQSAERGFYRALFGDERDSVELPQSRQALLDAVSSRVSMADSRRQLVPRLPSVIPRLMRTLRDPEASAKDYVDIINKDPAISAAVLQLANSVYFNRTRQHVADIELAVVNLGIEGLRSALSAAVMQPIIQRRSVYFSEFGHRLWRHSLCCAVTCEILAQQRGLIPFQAYLLGLTHDIGKITLFSELCKQLQAQGVKNAPGYEVFAPLMASLSAPLSLWIAKDWELPAPICAALEQQIALKPGAQVDPYGQLLYQANLACEVHATGRHQNAELARHLTDALSLPVSLFEQLDELTLEL